jgi:hypothetical protein
MDRESKELSSFRKTGSQSAELRAVYGSKKLVSISEQIWRCPNFECGDLSPLFLDRFLARNG